MCKTKTQLRLCFLLVALCVNLARSALAICEGDCDLDGAITIDELMREVQIALGTLPLAECPSVDRDGDQQVQVGELIGAVNNALFGTCEPSIDGLRFVEVLRDGDQGINGLRGPVALAMSPEGSNVYVISNSKNSIVTFGREPTTGRLSFLTAQLLGPIYTAHFHGPEALAVSPDGAQVYIAAREDDAIVAMERDQHSGTLKLLDVQIPPEDGSNGLFGPRAVIVSADGRNVYVAGNTRDHSGGTEYGALAVFARESNGALRLTEIHDESVNHGLQAYGLRDGRQIVVSPDGRQIYVAGWGGVVTFARNERNGTLSYLGVLQLSPNGAELAVTISPDGKYLYTAENHMTSYGQADGQFVTALARDAESGLLSRVATIGGDYPGVLFGVAALAMSPNGRNLYVGANILSVFTPRSQTGEIDLVETHREGANGSDTLRYAGAIAVSPDGHHLYVTGRHYNGVALFEKQRNVPTATSTATIIPGGPTLTPTPSRTTTPCATGTRPRCDGGYASCTGFYENCTYHCECQPCPPFECPDEFRRPGSCICHIPPSPTPTICIPTVDTHPTGLTDPSMCTFHCPFYSSESPYGTCASPYEHTACFTLSAPPNCCWKAYRGIGTGTNLTIISGQEGCGNGSVCYHLDANGPGECQYLNIAINNSALLFWQGAMPEPTATPTPRLAHDIAPNIPSSQ